MAKTHPDGWQSLEVTGARQREIETLAVLAKSLPEDYTVYHSIHWSTLERGHSVYGEVDFVVVNNAGSVLLIEQKSGFLDETADGLVKRYGGKTKSVAAQVSRSLHAFQSKLQRMLGADTVWIDYLFYCPDYHVKAVHAAGIEAGRIVDASTRGDLARIIQATFPPGEQELKAQKVHRFLRDELQLETDVSAMMGQARNMVARVSGGLAHWARKLTFSPYRLRVTGTAGSGKTQLALAEFRAAIEAGLRPLYVCYNRPLADHFSAIAPGGGVACTFHMLCDLHLQAHGVQTDFATPGVFEQLINRALDRMPLPNFRFDTVIVDEGQDFSELWRDGVLRHAKDDARVIWLEDPMQNLYARPPVSLPDWVGIRSEANYRSPRAIVRFLQCILPDDVRIEAQSPIDSAEVEILTYSTSGELLERMSEALRRTYAAGFRKEDVAIVTFRGRENSALSPFDRIGQNKLRSFTGRYDLLGQPEFTDGDVLIESVYRFKGQSVPAVILAEVDFESLDDCAVRKLFVGATRASLHLTLVISERAAEVLLKRLG